MEIFDPQSIALTFSTVVTLVGFAFSLGMVFARIKQTEKRVSEMEEKQNAITRLSEDVAVLKSQVCAVNQTLEELKKMITNRNYDDRDR
jgi:peptidoglycan hydrolase CwlO-like protein